MYELNRVRLYNIGPAGARYDDVPLDLSDGGPPIPAHTLIPSDGQLFRRPTPATLLVLENGGGKSVFIRMLLSTVLPERQSRKGREALRAYVVSAAAPSHVALEWVNVRTGETLVTGQVMAPTADDKLDRMFYSLQPNTATTLDTLPFAEDRRRLRMNAFHDALKRLDADDKTLHVEIEKRQGEWEKHLRRLGLEPDLFAVQQAMNVDEGDAAEAFKTTTGRQFAEWMLSKAMDADDFTELGDAFGAYAKNIGRREQLLLDRDFSTVTGAAAEQLARRKDAHTAAFTAARNAATTLGQLAAEIREFVHRSEDTVREHRARHQTARERTEERQHDRDHADLLHKEVRRSTLVLRRDAARAQAAQVQEQLDAERDELAACTLVPTVLKAAAAHEKYRVASELLDDAQLAAGTARLHRDQAGARFAGSLRGRAQRCATEADDLEHTSASTTAKVDEAEGHAVKNERWASSHAARAELLAQQVNKVDRRLEQARQSGLLEENESVAEADARHEAEADRLDTKVTQERAAHQQLEQDARRLQKRANQLIEPEVTARAAAEAAAQAITDTHSAADELTSHTLLRELAELDDSEGVPGGDPVLWLEHNASPLRHLAASVQASAGEQLDVLKADDRADQRLIAALTVEDDALMPPRQAVEDLLELLAGHGVDAMAGWRALEQLVNPRLHAAAIQAHPALVDGIVVTDQETLRKAQAVLTQNPLLPAAAVLVSTPELLHAEPAPPNSGFVVEPTPALHDSDAAAVLREQAETRIAGRRRPLEDLSARQTVAFHLEGRLDTWLHHHPPGNAEQTHSTAQALDNAAREARAALEAARNAYNLALETLDEHNTAVSGAEHAALNAARTRDAFGRLAQDAAEAATHRAEIRELHNWAEEHRATAQGHRDTAARLRGQVTEYAVQTESLRRDAASYTARMDKVAYGNQPLNPPTDEPDLAALEIAYEEAVAGLDAVEVGEDLLRRVEQAQKEASDRDGELRDQPADTVTLAQTLAASAQAGSTETLKATKRRLARTIKTLEGEHHSLSERSGQLHAETQTASRPGGLPWTSLDAEWTPANPAEGTRLTEQAGAALKHTETQLHEALNAERATERELRKTEAAARDMTAVHRGLASAVRRLDLPSGAAPFSKSADEAQQAADEATKTHSDAVDQLRDANQDLDEAILEFRDTANQNRFGSLKAPIYHQLTGIDKASLVERARQWAVELTGRAASLTTDLESSERHRSLLIDQLKHRTSHALGLLEKAERLSCLPEGAGGWARQKILKIGFSKPEAQVLAVRIAETLDETARTQPRLPGRDLVLRCVGAAVPRDFKVEILKPDAAGRADYASISDMSKVFSGGQELTGAIMLYCTLAALRSSTRTGTRSTTRLGGMLILDNPIGKANADYLLTLQMNMAAALGVQLIYTTGNMEDRVLATFPLCIRLRNDADQRTGTRHLHVTDRVARPTPPDEDDVTGRLSAARLLVKPRDAHTPPDLAEHPPADSPSNETAPGR
ncbi:hypothetical protein ACFZDM_33255 [Streptomyces californicus]|uniref:hypothetical protein n=1 Tax=Streptomyces californicus TaxID=67351 RepID=UPI0036EEEF42